MSVNHVPATVLAMRGKPITLIDGSTVQICYTFSSLMRIEDDFGTLMDAFIALNEGQQGRMMNTVANMLAAGLEHATHPTEGGKFVELSDVTVLRGLLDPQVVYADTITDAIKAAFPAVAEDAADAGGDDEPDPSLGDSGTTPPPSLSDALTQNSGTP